MVGVVLDQVDLGGGGGVVVNGGAGSGGVNEGEGCFEGGAGLKRCVIAPTCDDCVLVHIDPPFWVGVGEGVNPPSTPS